MRGRGGIGQGSEVTSFRPGRRGVGVRPSSLSGGRRIVIGGVSWGDEGESSSGEEQEVLDAPGTAV